MEITPVNRSAVRFASMEVLSKEDIVHQNNVLNLQGKNALGTMQSRCNLFDLSIKMVTGIKSLSLSLCIISTDNGSLLFSTSDSTVADIHVPIATLLSITLSSSSSLTFHHVRRSPNEFYEQRVWKSTVEFVNTDEPNNENHAKIVFNRVREGIQTAKRGRPQNILVSIM